MSIDEFLNEGRKPGAKEQKRREIYAEAATYIYKNSNLKSFSFDDDTNTFHFYSTDWSVPNSEPVLSMSLDDVKAENKK
jgi:hypothetical protein